MDQVRIGRFIAEERKKKGWTQKQLAEKLNISDKTVSKWECGDGYPDITLLPTIANFFEVTVDELIGNDEISAREDIQKNFFETVHTLSPDEQLELALKYHKKHNNIYKHQSMN